MLFKIAHKSMAKLWTNLVANPENSDKYTCILGGGAQLMQRHVNHTNVQSFSLKAAKCDFFHYFVVTNIYGSAEENFIFTISQLYKKLFRDLIFYN